LFLRSLRQLLIKDIRLLWRYIFDDLDPPFYTLRFQWELCFDVRHFWNAELTDNIRATLETDFLRIVGTREMVSDVALFITFYCAENSSSHEFAYLTPCRSELFLRKIEVEQFSISGFLDFFCP